MAGAGKGSHERLRTEAVLRLLERMQDDLSRHQLERLRKLAELIDSDGRIGLDRALDVATPGGDDQRRQAAFRQFRRTVAEAAEAAQVRLALVPDSLKLAPVHRFCWFEGENEDPVLGELVAMSKDKSRRRGPAEGTVEPRVSQVRPLAPIRVHVCAASASEDRSRAGKVEEFIRLLRRDLRTGESRDIQVSATHDIEMGLTEAGERALLREQADIVVALLTPAYLAGHKSEIDELTRRPVELLLVAFAALPGAGIHALGPRQNRIMRENSPYDSHGYRGRGQFVADVAAVIRCLLDNTLGSTASVPGAAGTAQLDDDRTALERVSRLTAASRRSADAKVDPRASEIGLDPASVSLAADGRLSRARGEAVLAVDRLVEWASSTAPDAPRLCALLGDLGMGKTTTAKLFTERLLGLRGEDTAVPVPVLFDLRDISVAALPAQPTLEAVVSLLLEATEGAGQVTAGQVLAAIARGNCMVIFDGLDEVLVHLDPHQGQLFVRALWRAIDLPGRAHRPAARNTGSDPAIRPTRLLLTCRTHYFRSVRDEVGSFTGQDRDGPAGRDYLALLMLPFGEEQVRAYLAANVPGMDVDALLALIDSVHDLRELTERPLTLSYVTEQLEFIEQAKLRGHAIRPVDMYGAMVDRWLARDHGKHVLLPEHKLAIMEALAAKLWRGHRNSWSVGDLEQWLLEFLAGRPDLELHYGQRRPDLWKEDLRTATFLVRCGDEEFSFAHTSLLEYFLSRYLLRALMSDADDLDALTKRWTMPRPSQETLDFFGQGLAELDAGTWQACRRALAALAADYRPGPSEVAFAYGLAAAHAGYPHHRLAGTRLTGADLRGWQIGSRSAGSGAGQAHGTDLLDLSGIVLNGADLTDSRFDGTDLRGADMSRADLTRALITRSDMRDADLTDSALVGTILRACRLNGARTASPTTYRAQALLCEPAGIPDAPGWLHAPVSSGSLADKGRLVALTGHTGWVQSVAYHPDGTRLATAGDDGTVRIWDAVTGEHLHTLVGHTDWVQVVAYRPDGTRLATAGDDDTVRIWDAVTGEHLQTLVGHSGIVHSVAYHPDGTRLATASDDGTVRIWDAVTGEDLHTLTGHTGWVRSVAYQPDGTRLATGGGDLTVRIWDTATGEHLRTLTGHTGPVQSVAYQPDGTRLATAGGGDMAVRIWDTATGEHLHTLTGHTGWVRSVAYHPDGTRLAAGGGDMTVRIWDTATGEHLRTLIGHTGMVRLVAYHPDGTRLATAGGDGTVRIWDAVTGEHLHTLTGHTGWVRSVAYQPDGTRLATGGGDMAVRIWDLATGEHLHTLTGHTGTVQSVAYQPDGTRLAVGGGDGTVRIWDTLTGEHLHTLTGHTGWVRSVAYRPDGTRLATGSGDGTVRIWDTATGEHLRILTGHTGTVQSVAYQPDGTRLAVGGGDGTVRIWDTLTGEHLHTLAGHTDWVRSVAYQPDGTRLATGSGDGTVRIWDTATGEQADWYVEHLPDGELALWDAETGDLLGATSGAWYWLGWSVVVDGALTRLPAESYGLLPSIPGLAS
ncbi:MAG TPA: pentapeptide repeat-containing protein [Streptosporangiaceae bacterium]